MESIEKIMSPCGGRAFYGNNAFLLYGPGCASERERTALIQKAYLVAVKIIIHSCVRGVRQRGCARGRSKTLSRHMLRADQSDGT
jgi:hypothetical protein